MKRIIVISLISFFLFSTCLLLATTLQAEGSSDLASLSYEAFTGLSAVYRAGGNSTILLSQLNTALEQIQTAKVERAMGRTAEAQQLEDQARGTLEKIISEVPGAQQQALEEAMRTRIMVLLFIPISVAICTGLSYLAIMVWRWYDTSRLYEMRIVEKKN